jgi:ribonuclease P protein subunit RPR2
MRSNRDKSSPHQKIALERISKLFEQAELSFSGHPELSSRYIEMARKMAMKYKVRFTEAQRQVSCKKCNAYLRQGVNSRVRLEHGKVVQTCLECKNVRRKIYK